MWSGFLLPSIESCSLFGLQRSMSACPIPFTRVQGVTCCGGFLQRAVLSVSLSISNRMRPGRSLLAESGCVSGKTLRSGSDTLELVSGQKQEICYQCMVMSKRPPTGTLRGREAGEIESQLMRTNVALLEAPLALRS